MPAAPFSVIIPAHNEGNVVRRCLEAVYRDAPQDALPEVIVAANGCTDDTVAIARDAAPLARVLDLPVGSKVIAMNEANALASATPRFFLDADVQCDYASLAATADVLRQPGVMAASPALRMDLSRCDRWVKAYYRVWLTQPYVTDRLVGSGLFGLSREAVERVMPLPEVIADDLYVKESFAPEERRNISKDCNGESCFFVVYPPRTAFDQIRIEERRLRGNIQLARREASGNKNRTRMRFRFRNTEELKLLDIAAYVIIKSAVRILYRINKLRGLSDEWTRDEGARAG